MPTTGIRGSQVKDDSLTGDDIDEATLVLSTIKDADGDTKVQVEESSDEDKIRFDTGGTERMIIDASGVLISGSLHISGSNQEGIRIAKGDDDYRQIVFENDGVDGANLHLSNAENLVMMNETQGKDIQFWVDPASGGSNIQALTIKEDGKVGVGTTSPSTIFHAYGNISNEYVATIDNDQSSGGHVLKLQTDGNGSGSRILEMEDGDGDIVFRARADGRFGFGPDGVSSMGAGTFVVGIDNSSHTADIAISQRLQHRGDSNTYLDFPSADTVNLVAGGGSFLKYENSSGKILINNSNSDRDTRIMDANGDVVLHIDAGDSRVGVGTTSPSELLSLNGVEPNIQFSEGGSNRAKIGINDSDNLVIHNQSSNKHIVFKVNDAGQTREGLRLDGAVPEVVVNQQSESLINFRVESDNNTHMLFVTGSGKVGINTSAPASTLSIMGSLALKVHSINAANDPGTSYAISTTDCVLLINTRPTAQGGIDSAITLTLPDASDNPGMVLTIKDAAGYCDVNAITIAASVGDNLDGNPSTTSMDLPSPASWKKLISDGANSWYEIGS